MAKEIKPTPTENTSNNELTQGMRFNPERDGFLPVSLQRTTTPFTDDVVLWEVIRQTTDQLSFDNYKMFIEEVLCESPKHVNIPKKETATYNSLQKRRHLPYNDTDAYRLLKVATEAFLVVNCGIPPGDLDSTFSIQGFNNTLEQGGIGSPPESSLNGINTQWRQYRGIKANVGQAGNQTLDTPEPPILPYLLRIRNKFPELNLSGVINGMDPDNIEICDQLIGEKLQSPCMVELIWSYWHEEAMLVQTMNAISMRFQNVRITEQGNPLAMMEINPLRPLNNLMWGYIQDEQHRLSVLRRVYEYDHHYGLTLYGKAIPQIRPADSRSKFLEAFHNLLYLCTIFFKEADDTTIVPDGFPILNALKEVHLLLSEGAHNQFGDLPTTARIEMLMQQWLLSRPEFREFLPSRASVAYPEDWMGGVDAMKNAMGWTDVSAMHFNKLANFGEKLLLSIRYGDWSSIDEPIRASNWAKSWRPQIQGYTYSYRTVTRVDLTADITDGGQTGLRYLPPSVHLQQRLREQQSQQRALPPGQGFPSVVTAQPRLTQSRMRQLRPRN